MLTFTIEIADAPIELEPTVYFAACRFWPAMADESGVRMEYGKGATQELAAQAAMKDMFLKLAKEGHVLFCEGCGTPGCAECVDCAEKYKHDLAEAEKSDYQGVEPMGRCQ